LNLSETEEVWEVLGPAGRSEDVSTYELDTRYCGVCSVISSTHATPYLHGILHCEDWWINGDLYDGVDKPYGVYHRIGYARSRCVGNATDAHYFTKLKTADAPAVPTVTPTPVGGWGGRIITAAYSEEDFIENRGEDQPCGGVGQPHIVAGRVVGASQDDDEYYYVFYTRVGLVDHPTICGGIEVARARASLLNLDQSSYENLEAGEIWRKYTSDEEWSGDPITATGELLLQGGAGSYVSWNTEVDKWVMAVEYNYDLSVHFADPGETWYKDWGEKIIVMGENKGRVDGFYYPCIVGSSTGYGDKLTAKVNKFYWSAEAGGEPPHTLKRQKLRIEDE